jgi:hypothetical protein
VRRLLKRCRPLAPRDLVLPENAPAAPPPEDAGLARRAGLAAAALRAAAAAVASARAQLSGLRRAAALGVMGAADALLGSNPGPEVVAAVGAELARRTGALDAAEAQPHEPDPNARHAAAIRAALGEEFLPLAAVKPADPAGLEAGLEHGEALLRAEPDRAAARHWLQRVARVRPGVTWLRRVQLAGAALGTPAQPEVRVLQLPVVAGEPWVGSRATVAGTRLNVALLASGALDPAQPLAGLLADEWVEVVPGTEATTGFALHFDTPGGQAPQAVLLAVPPDPAQSSWQPDVLEQTLVEALALAKVRAVDLDALEAVGQLLPALSLPNNVAGDTASTDVLPAPAP